MAGSDGTLGFGVLGLGMGANRARTVAKTEGARLVAVCDLIEEKARVQAQVFGCDWYTDYEKMLAREDIDVIYVMTFSGLHAKHGIMAAQAGKHVISTKPLDVTVQAVDDLINACRGAGVKLVTDFETRYGEQFNTIKNAADTGVLGRIILAEARLKWFRAQSYYDENGGWRGTWALDGGGSLSNQTVHYIDQLCGIMGDVSEVYAELGVYNHNIEGEDLGTAIVNFASGAKGVIVGTTTFPNHSYAGIEIHGDRGAAMTTRGKDTEWVWAEGCEADPETLKVKLPVRNAVEDLLRAVKLGCDPIMTGEEGRKSVVLLEAIRESALSRQVVRLQAGC